MKRLSGEVSKVELTEKSLEFVCRRDRRAEVKKDALRRTKGQVEQYLQQLGVL